MTELFAPIARPRRLPDEIAEKILRAIDSGRLRPGDRLPTEHDLSRRFGVARTVVREAVSLLKYDGVIDARRGVGAFIAVTDRRRAFRISPECFEKRQQLRKLLQLRTSVQADAAALAAVERSTSELRAMRGWLDTMAESVSADDASAEQWVDAEAGLYRAITEASGNEYFVEFVGMIDAKVMDNLRSVVVKNAMVAERGDAVLAEHAAVVDAIQAGEADGARDATRSHFECAAKRLADRADFADV